jgi:hypothetical protein
VTRRIKVNNDVKRLGINSNISPDNKINGEQVAIKVLDKSLLKNSDQ